VTTPIQPLLPHVGEVPSICWRRSARARRISLRIDARSGQVVVTLPKRAAKSAGMALLNDNAAWVAARLAALPEAVRFEAGASVTIDGLPHVIRHEAALRGGAWIGDGALHVTGAPEFMARRVGDFLRAEARRRFSAQALAKARLIGVTPRRVVVKDTRSRWGSCSPDGVLMFCWRLVMAPPFVQDYAAPQSWRGVLAAVRGAGAGAGAGRGLVAAGWGRIAAGGVTGSFQSDAARPDGKLRDSITDGESAFLR
jgi:predicted metal-dependent hydrolase